MISSGAAKRAMAERTWGICKHNAGEHYNAHFVLRLDNTSGSDEDSPAFRSEGVTLRVDSIRCIPSVSRMRRDFRESYLAQIISSESRSASQKAGFISGACAKLQHKATSNFPFGDANPIFMIVAWNQVLASHNLDNEQKSRD